MSFFFLNDIFLAPWKYLPPCTLCNFIQHGWHFDSIMFIKIILCNMDDLQQILMNNTKLTYQRENKVIKSFVTMTRGLSFDLIVLHIFEVF